MISENKVAAETTFAQNLISNHYQPNRFAESFSSKNGSTSFRTDTLS